MVRSGSIKQYTTKVRNKQRRRIQVHVRVNIRRVALSLLEFTDVHSYLCLRHRYEWTRLMTPRIGSYEIVDLSF